MRAPIVHSEYLFRSLARQFGVALICDVGAFDCAHSKRFRKTGARVIAFEANPYCFEALSADASVAEAGIELVNRAVWDKDESIVFHVVKLGDAGEQISRTPISSVLERMPAYGFAVEPTEVPAVRLDTYLQDIAQTAAGPIAIWVDAEGAGYQVIDGMKHLRDSICLVHVEVETQTFWMNQHLCSEVMEIMRRFGFTPIARRPGDLQYDVLFVNDRWLEPTPLLVRWWVAKAWCRLKVGQIRSKMRWLNTSSNVIDRLRWKVWK